MKYMKSLLFSGLFSCFLVACGGDSTPEAKAPEVPPPAPAPIEPAPAPEAAGEAAGASTVPPEPAPAPAPEPLTDEQIAAVADAANTGEIEQAKLAQKKAKNAQVKKLAAMILTHHTAIKQKMTKVLAKAKVTPATSPASTQLTEDGTKLLETLKTAEGADFDKAYVDAQVDEHKKVLETLDTQLIPNAKNADLKAELEDVRTKVEAHLKAAQDAQTALAAAPADKGAATPATTKGGSAAPKKAESMGTKAPTPAPTPAPAK